MAEESEVLKENMMYTIKFYRGDYRTRQVEANRDKAVCYVEHHFNSSSDPSAAYALVVTGSNSSRTSREWGRWYAHRVAMEFGSRLGGDDGIKVGGYQGRGDSNLRYTKMPAILLEPLFASNPRQAALIRSDWGRMQLANILVESIREFFPSGGLVAFSVGHKYKTTNPHDLGAPVYGGGMEADFAELVLIKAADLLKGC